LMFESLGTDSQLVQHSVCETIVTQVSIPAFGTSVVKSYLEFMRRIEDFQFLSYLLP
jgi:hypothetical protein